MEYKLGFIGTGNMGGALAVAAGKSMDPRRIVVANRTPEKARALAAQVGCAAAEHNEDVASHAEYIVLGVKPNVMRDVVRGLSPTLAACVRAGKPRVLVSIAAGIPVAAIKACLEVDVPVIRVMPNTPVLVGQGMLLLASSAQNPGEVSEERFAEFQRMFAAAGDFERIPESAMDITGGVSGCTPAYVYLFIEALADGAVQTGVPRGLAMRLAAKAVLGSAAMVLETGKHPGALKDAVCSPGGSTIMGVAALEQHGFRGAVARAVVQSTEKNCALGK